MSVVYHNLIHSKHPLARLLRRLYWCKEEFTLPLPIVLFVPFAWSYRFFHSAYCFLKRVLICEPYFKAHCRSVGRGVLTGEFLHYIEGSGEIHVGSHVKIDGKCGFLFTSRYTSKPTLTIGDRTTIGHECSFTVAKSITVGNHCLLASGVLLFDTSGHPVDPELRLAGRPAADDEVKPIVIGNNVWIGRRAIIFPGVTIGDNVVVAAGSAVMSSVPENAVVAGYPARRINMQPPLARAKAAESQDVPVS